MDGRFQMWGHWQPDSPPDWQGLGWTDIGAEVLFEYLWSIAAGITSWQESGSTAFRYLPSSDAEVDLDGDLSDTKDEFDDGASAYYRLLIKLDEGGRPIVTVRDKNKSWVPVSLEGAQEIIDRVRDLELGNV